MDAGYPEVVSQNSKRSVCVIKFIIDPTRTSIPFSDVFSQISDRKSIPNRSQIDPILKSIPLLILKFIYISFLSQL